LKSKPVTDLRPEGEGAERTAKPVAFASDRGERWLSLGLIVLSGLVLVAALFVTVAHFDDRFGVDHVAGARIALAQYFNDGTLYPELYDGRHYGGTRFMPLPVILHGLIARMTGEYLVSGKLLSSVTMLALLVTVFLLLRRMRCPLALSMALTTLVLATKTGLLGTIDLRFDTTPLLLQLLAIAIVATRTRRAGVIGAAALASLALLSKLSAVWAPLAIVGWLFVRDRKLLAWFSGAYVAFVGVLVLFFAGVTDGRILENVFGLSTSGITELRSILVAPYRLLHIMVAEATAAWALLPAAALAIWAAAKERSVSLYVLSLVAAAVVLIVVLGDVGTGRNQLIDVIVLAILVIGEWAGRTWSERMASSIRVLVGLMMVWLIASGLAVTVAPAAQSALRADVSYRSDPLAGVAEPMTRILSEDPYVPVSLGQVPEVLDPFMLLRIGQRNPSAVQELVRRIDDQEFDLVVLVENLEPLDRQWWNEEHFGPEVVRAISRSYVYEARVQGYYVYTPRRGAQAG
jgi:hypothetical protein